MTNESNAGERNEAAHKVDQDDQRAEPTAAELQAAKEAQEIADGHRYMPQEMRDAREAAGKPDRKKRNDKPDPKKDAAKKAAANSGDRIAKVMARAGIASRREIERLIGLGKVAVNGRILETPAVLVKPTDVITVEGRVIGKAEPTRLFRYHKPVGLVTTERDPEGRPTVFDKLPKDLPRVLKVGRLDLNSEGLLLLTNDGELARGLELPGTGWVRRYRVRALGQTTQARLDQLKDGTTIDGVLYGPIEATLDKALEKADGRANLWLTVALTEGKNREVRKVLDSIGLKVNRLIRLAYGPFQLGNLEPGEVEEVGPRVIRELLTDLIDPRNLPPEGASQTRRAVEDKAPGEGRRGGGDRFGAGRGDSRGDKPAFRDRNGTGAGDRPAKAWKPREEMAKREFKPRDFAERPRFEGDGVSRDAAPSEGRAWTPRPERGERTREPSKKAWEPRREGGERSERPAFKRPYGARSDGERSGSDRPSRPYVKRDDVPAGEAGAYERAKREFGGGADSGYKKPYAARSDDRPKRDFGAKPYGDRPARAEGGFKKPYTPREGGEGKAYGAKPYGDRPARAEGGFKKPYTPREGGEGRSYGAKPYGDRPARAEGGFKKPYTPREGGEGKSYGAKPYGDRPARSEGGFKKPYAPREGGEGKSYGAKPYGDRPARAEGGYKKPYAPREGGEAKSYGARSGEDRPKRDYGAKPYGDRPARPEGGFKKPYAGRSDAPRGDKPAWKPRAEGGAGGRPFNKGPSSGGRPAGRPASGPRKPRPE